MGIWGTFVAIWRQYPDLYPKYTPDVNNFRWMAIEKLYHQTGSQSMLTWTLLDAAVDVGGAHGRNHISVLTD
jgi:hypothetical protein